MGMRSPHSRDTGTPLGTFPNIPFWGKHTETQKGNIPSPDQTLPLPVSTMAVWKGSAMCGFVVVWNGNWCEIVTVWDSSSLPQPVWDLGPKPVTCVSYQLWQLQAWTHGLCVSQSLNPSLCVMLEPSTCGYWSVQQVRTLDSKLLNSGDIAAGQCLVGDIAGDLTLLCPRTFKFWILIC